MPSRSYRISRQAVCDLEDIVDYLAKRDVRAADDVLVKLLDTMQLLAENPHAGLARDDLHTGLRIFVPTHPASHYVVFYYVAVDMIEVSDVIHAFRDWTGMFARGER